MMAKEYFEGVRACQRAIDRRLAVLASMRHREEVRAQTYDAIGRATGNKDVMRATDIRIDAENAALSGLAAMRAEVEGGRALCRGVRAANAAQRWADALELHYVEDMTWRQTANALGVSERQAQLDISTALDWIDSVGIAQAKSGTGRAAPSS